MRGSHLIFDLDGTLTDPREGITRCFVHVLDQLGRPAPSQRELERYIGPPLREVLAELLETNDAARVEHALRIYRERFSTVGLFENVPYGGIHDTLAQLREDGHTLWVCTTKAAVYARRILARFDLGGFFTETYGAELDGTRSDKVELLAHLLDREAIDPASAIMIGDRKHDVRAARASGSASIGVLYGFGDEAELRAAGADALCPEPTALPGAIAQIPPRKTSVKAGS